MRHVSDRQTKRIPVTRTQITGDTGDVVAVLLIKDVKQFSRGYCVDTGAQGSFVFGRKDEFIGGRCVLALPEHRRYFQLSGRGLLPHSCEIAERN
jgi:hypothetical protein